ncbi:MAG: hypothetical protein WC763_06705 [Candidatus Paceibacterota bacterium]
MNKLHAADIPFSVWTKSVQTSSCNLSFPMSQYKWEAHVWTSLYNGNDSLMAYIRERDSHLGLPFAYTHWDELVADGVVTPKMMTSTDSEFDYTKWPRYQHVDWTSMTFSPTATTPATATTPVS